MRYTKERIPRISGRPAFYGPGKNSGKSFPPLNFAQEVTGTRENPQTVSLSTNAIRLFAIFFNRKSKPCFFVLREFWKQTIA